METELLKIYDDDRNERGVATRAEVHQYGYWHVAFHCWFIYQDEIYLQIRSDRKEDYPSLLDITAAGHLLATETVEDGVREIKEELGIEVSFDELVPIGIIDYHVTKEKFIDKEIANVFLYSCHQSLDEFILQKEEVAGMVKTKLIDFKNLWLGKMDAIRIEGFQINADGTKCLIDEFVGRSQFVPHPPSYYEAIVKNIKFF